MPARWKRKVQHMTRPDFLEGAKETNSIPFPRVCASLACAMGDSTVLVGSVSRNYDEGPVDMYQLKIETTAARNTTGSGGGGGGAAAHARPARRGISEKSLRTLNRTLRQGGNNGSARAHVAVAGCGSFAVVAYGYKVFRFDFADDKITVLALTSQSNYAVSAVAISPDGSVAYLTYGKGVYGVDTSGSNQDCKLVAGLPNYSYASGVAVDPSGSFLLVSSSQSDTVDLMTRNGSAWKTSKTWNYGSWCPGHIAICPDSSSALVVDSHYNRCWVLNLNDTVSQPVPFQALATTQYNSVQSVTFSSDGTFVLFACGNPNNSRDSVLQLVELPEGSRRRSQERNHLRVACTGEAIVRGTKIQPLRELVGKYRRIVPKLNTQCETEEQQRRLQALAQAAERRLQELLQEQPRAAQLQEVMNGTATSFSQLRAAIEAAEEPGEYKPLADGPLAKVVVQARDVLASRKKAVEHLLMRRLGSDVATPLLTRLEEVHIDSLDHVARSVSPWTCKCKPAPFFAPLHEAPQEVLREAKALAKALDDLTAELGLNAAATKKDADTVREKQSRFEKEIVLQCKKAGPAQRLTEQSTKTLAQLQASIVHLTQQNVRRLATLAEEAASRLEVSSTLGERAKSVSEQCLSDWHSWQDRLTVRDSVLSFGHDALERFLVTMGRCWWVEPLKASGVDGATLVRATETALLGVLSAADPPASFADVRSLKLAVDSLQAGAGLPAWLASGGTVDDPDDGAVRKWSAIAVKKHLDSNGLETLATQCNQLGITGAVLLSLSDEERDMRVPPGHGAKGLQLSAAFGAAVRELKKLDSGDGASPSSASSAGSVTAAVDARLSHHVVQALCAETAVPPVEFPIEYIRRCTHGFDDAHEIGSGSFGSVYVCNRAVPAAAVPAFGKSKSV